MSRVSGSLGWLSAGGRVNVTEENGSSRCLSAGRAGLAVSARMSQLAPGFGGSLIAVGLHEAVEKQSEMFGWAACPNSSSAREQGTGPPPSACTPWHHDLRGPQPGHWVSLTQLTRSQADLGRNPLKRPHSSLIALRRLSPAPAEHGAGRNSAGPWEPLPKPWPCSRLHGKARGTAPASPGCATTAFDLTVTTSYPLLNYFYFSLSF